jgi:hypothetical protein
MGCMRWLSVNHTKASFMALLSTVMPEGFSAPPLKSRWEFKSEIVEHSVGKSGFSTCNSLAEKWEETGARM